MNENPFSDLPAALVQEIINKSQELGAQVVAGFEELRLNRQKFREQLSNAKVIKRENNLPHIPIPTSCGVDGAYGVERLLAFDLVATVAVAMEGLTPPSEPRHWVDPRYYSHVSIEPHSSDTENILRGLMMGMEYSLAIQAPHDVIFLDGSLTTAFIYLNQALSKIDAMNGNYTSTPKILLEEIENILNNYLSVLKSERSDKGYVAIPKYTTKKEFGKKFNWSDSYDDRAMLTDLLDAGEYTEPQPLDLSEQNEWHININRIPQLEPITREIKRLLNQIHVIYYKPTISSPALRLEVSQAIAKTPARLSAVINAVKHQCSSPAMLEPYPLYMADRMAKSLGKSISTFRQIITQKVSEDYKGDISEIFINLNGYRTESGG